MAHVGQLNTVSKLMHFFYFFPMTKDEHLLIRKLVSFEVPGTNGLLSILT